MTYVGPYWEEGYNFAEYTSGSTLLIKGYARDNDGKVSATQYWTTVNPDSDVTWA